jgi:MoxR-like ATPase
LKGRDFVTPDDVRQIAPNVLRHRIIVRGDMTADEALQGVLERVPVPEVSASLVYA